MMSDNEHYLLFTANNPDGEASLFERQDPPPTQKRQEEILADKHGGLPEEWIPDVERYYSVTADHLRAGVPVLFFRPTPEVEGEFEGYIKIEALCGFDQDHNLIFRILYASAEQIDRGHFFVPREGLFTLDESASPDDLEYAISPLL